MNAVDTEEGRVPSPKLWRRRGCVTAVLLVAAFAFGIVCGAGGSIYIIAKRVQANIRHPEQRVENGTRTLTRRLGLTESQEPKVRAILQTSHQAMSKLRRRQAPEVARLLTETDQQITEVLTQEQRAKWRQLVDRWRRAWLPPEIDSRLPPPDQPRP